MATNIFDRSQLDSRSNPNLLTNGDFSVWQRGTVSSHTGFAFALTADRWFTYVGGGTITVSEGYGYGSGVQKQGFFIDSDNGATDVQIGQRIESSMFSSNDFGYGEQFTFSIWVYGESDDSDLGFVVSVPDTVDSYTSATTKVAEYFGTPKANEWTKLTITFPWHKDFNRGMQIAITIAGTFQQGLTFSRAKLESGPVATPFIPDHPAVNLAKCQRYYQVWKSLEVVGMANVYTSSNHGLHITPIVTMRTTPLVDFNQLYVLAQGGSGDVGIISSSNVIIKPHSVYATLGTGAISGAVAGMALSCRVQGGATFYLDAEIF